MKLEAVESPVARAVNGVLSLSDQVVAAELIERLGERLTGLLEITATTTRADKRSGRAGDAERPQALRAALQATRALAIRYGNEAARGWFMSTNPDFDMTSPVLFLRDTRAPERLKRLVTCAVQEVS